MQSDITGSRCVVHFMSASVVMCVGGYVRCGVKWYVCVGVPPSSASFLREHLCECMNRTT